MTTITRINDMTGMRWIAGGVANIGIHGYCTVRTTGRTLYGPLFDVYCQIDGDEVRIGRELTEADAVMFVNRANAEMEAGA